MPSKVLAFTLVAALLSMRGALAQTFPAGFAEDVVAANLTVPVAMAFLPDGRILVVEKNGIVRVVKNGALLATPFIDLRSRVNDYWDRGMLGIAVDPDFTINGFVYLYYVFENDPTRYDGPKTARLTRVTASGDTAAPSTEVVLLGSAGGPSCGGMPAGADCIPADSPSHNGGSIRAAADGTLFLTTGDGASFNVVDDLALRAQNVDSLAGKLLHVTRTGRGLSGNPFWNGNADAVRSKVRARGFRNPFRASLRPVTEQPYIGDVGWSLFEEVNVGRSGANLGWPCYEGPNRQPGYESLAGCQSLYAQGTSAVQAPLVSYGHDGVTAAVTGGVFYTGSTYPSAYRSAYVYGDYARGFLRYFQVDTGDGLTGTVNDFASALPGPVQIEMGPDDSLYYVAIIAGEVRRIRYTQSGGGGTGEGTQSLSDLAWTSATNGWGPVERDRSNGEAAAGDGRTITLNGRTYTKGLGVHAMSDIRFRLDGECTSFESDIGVDDEVGSSGSVVFQVWADGTKLYDSGVMTGATSTIHVAEDVGGRQELGLVVTSTDSLSFDHADWAGATITCGSGGGGGGTPPGLFASAVNLPAGTNTHSVTVADLNGDARADLVAANAGSNTASVWHGTSTGTFGSPSAYPTGRAPKHVAVGDLNKDGRPDLVSANQDAASVSVLLARSNGGFAAAVSYAVCSGTHESAIGDFNRDGSADVIVACWDGSVVSLLAGRGDGTFAPRVNFNAGASPHSIVAVDFNSDGLLDAAVANHGSADVSVLLGRGDGTFAGQVRYGVGNGPHSIRSGDVNGDGRIDLVTANDASHTVSVLNGRGDGTFAAAVHHAVGQVPKGVAVADVDADGSLDILSANTAGNYPTCCNPGGDTITLRRGSGSGTFASPETFTVGNTPFAVSTGDLDGDGDLDVVTANWHSNSVSILANLGGGDPPPQVTDVAATGITSSGATISWNTSEPADGQVEYGVSTSYGSTSSLQTALTTTHQVTLSGLQAGTTYHYRVRSRDSGGNLQVSNDFTFSTTGGGTGTGTTTYLSDLTWTSMTNGWGPAERDRSNGEQGASDGRVITLNGVTYPKGLGVHAASDIRYAIPSGCTQFRSDIGVDDEVGNSGSVVFEVWGGATRLFQSTTLLGSSPTGAVTVDVTGRSELRLVVTDAGNGASHDHADWAGARLMCGGTTSNSPPTATITAPAATLQFKVGDVIDYAGSGTDPEDGTLAASRLTWNVVLHHCPEGSCHTHPFGSSTGATGSFTVPDHGDESFFELRLTATDSGGATNTASRAIQPQTVQVTLDTVPAGLQVVYGGVAGTAPMTRTTIVGSTHTISVPSPQGSNVFSSWSDGGAQQHNVVVGSANARYTATFTQATSGTTVYLSDLTWASMTNGWGPAERDRSNGEQGATDGRVITLNGVTYPKGLGVHAASELRYAIPAGCTEFRAQIGVDDEVGANGSVRFQVWGDTAMLFESATLLGSSATAAATVDVSGRSDLRLVVTDAGNGAAYDHADWADARLSCGTSSTSSAGPGGGRH